MNRFSATILTGPEEEYAGGRKLMSLREMIGMMR